MSYSCWVWVVQEDDGTEGAIAAMVPQLRGGLTVLMHKKQDVAEALEPIARRHETASGRPVRLVHLREV